MLMMNNVLLGIAFAAIGVALPGLINMTSVSMTLKHGIKGGIYYSAGASATIFIQALIAVSFAGYLANHLEVFTSIRKVAILIFLILSIFFFCSALNPKVKESSKKQGPAFLVGMAVAALNILNIPYYFTSGTFLEASDLVELELPMGLLFVGGLSIGAFLGLLAYAYFAQYISRKAHYFVRNLNYFLSGLFLILAVVQAVQVYL